MPRTSFDASFYVSAYEAARSGETDAGIARCLGVTAQTIKAWKATKPSFKAAIVRGRKAAGGHSASDSFKEFVYKRLPADLQELWNYIQELDPKDASQIERLEALLSDAGVRARQHLYLNALIATNFNNGRALRMLNTSYQTLNNWKKNDPQFGEMLTYMHEAKKDFFEASLLKAVDRGELAAILFANETMNRDRGYGRKSQVEVEGAVQHTHNHNVMTIEQLDLPLETQKLLLTAVRERQLAIEGKVSNVTVSD